MRCVVRPIVARKNVFAPLSHSLKSQLTVLGAIGTSVETVFGARVRFTCPEGQVFATGVDRIDTRCMPGGKWSQAYIPKCQQVIRII
jgi:hypothetical protein